MAVRSCRVISFVNRVLPALGAPRPARANLAPILCAAVTALLLLGLAAPVRAVELTPSDALISVLFAADELELIRREMGGPKDTRPELDIKDVSPREVYFQAMGLYHKINRLCLEQALESADPPEAQTGDWSPAAVKALTDAAAARLSRVKTALSIPEQSRPRPRDPNATPTDVFRAILGAERQANLLLERRFSPSDVYEQLTRAMGYAVRLLALVPNAQRIPPTPPLERGKTPSEVFAAVKQCIELERLIYQRLGLTMLSLQSSGEAERDLGPSDVYDLVVIATAELASLHSRLGLPAPPKAYYPGRKYPAHTYQRTNALKAQLHALAEAVEKNPKAFAAKAEAK